MLGYEIAGVSMKIVVMAGGLSPEREVSLSSGSMIANALMDNGHSVCLADLYVGVEAGDFGGLFADLKSGRRYSYAVPEHEPDLDKLRREAGNGDALIGRNVLELCRHADLVFLALHGDIGENGKLQAVFDSFGIKYTGTGYAGSLLAMDKDIAKMLMLQHGILTPEWEIAGGWPGYPCVVKPCGCGSSVGVSIVNNEREYAAAVERAGKYEDKIMAEKMIAGREFTVGVLDGRALPAVEIIPKEGFFDYKNKYQPGATLEVCPAEIDGGLAAEMGGIALRVHEVLRLGSYSRIDFMLDGGNNIYCLEANTLPGMTPTSLLPQEAAAVGIDYNSLCAKIVELALRG